MAERYASAARLLDPRGDGLLRNADVVPTWIGDTDRFWYRRDLENGHDYVIVDAASGATEVAVEPCAQLPEPDPTLAWSPDRRRALASRDGNLWPHEPGEPDRQLTHDGTPDDGYGIRYDNWKAGFVPRSRSGGQPPFGVQWAPDGQRVVVARIDQRHVAPYPLLDSVPRDGGLRPQVHLPRIPLVGEPEPT